jgi:hypothetical protein
MPPIVFVAARVVVVFAETEYLKKYVFWEFADCHPWTDSELACNAQFYNRARMTWLSPTSTFFNPQLFPSTRNNHSRI